MSDFPRDLDMARRTLYHVLIRGTSGEGAAGAPQPDAPLPCVVKGVDLGRGWVALRLEQDVVLGGSS